MKLSAAGRKQEVGVQTETLDPTVRRSLNIPLDRERLSASDMALLKEVRANYYTEDVTPMNAKYGPISGISEGERLLRAYRLGLLSPRAKRRGTRDGPSSSGSPAGSTPSQTT